MEKFHSRWIGVDPGKKIGMVVIDSGKICGAYNFDYPAFWAKMTSLLLNDKCTVVIEDIKPFALQLTPDVIETCKLIGEMNYRLISSTAARVVMIPRMLVQRWAFERMADVVVPLVKDRIHKKTFKACSVPDRKEILVDIEGNIKRGTANFTYVNDKIVTQAVRAAWKIPLPAPGSGYAFGLKDHAWQALAAVTAYQWQDGEQRTFHQPQGSRTQLELYSTGQ